jgi:Formyl transferase
MYPTELGHSEVLLPDSSDKSIVLINFNTLRHERFAYRMKETFGDRVVAWYRLDKSCAQRYNQLTTDNKDTSRKAKLLALARTAKWLSRGQGKIAVAQSAYRVIKQKLDWRRFGNEVNRAEQRMFGSELDRLRKSVELDPIDIHPADVGTSEFISEIRAISPYFILSLGGPLYKKELLESVRGLVVNHHAGHSPKYKGTHTTEWALYHRDLPCISSTVHVTTTGADAGPILRRSNPCIFPDDTPATIFLRVAALGTELMIEAVKDMIATDSAMTFPQPPTDGMTYLSKHMPPHVLRSIYRDFRNGWLEDELIRRSRF